MWHCDAVWDWLGIPGTWSESKGNGGVEYTLLSVKSRRAVGRKTRPARYGSDLDSESTELVPHDTKMRS